MAVRLSDTKSVMAALSVGTDLYNIRTHEFYSVSAHALMNDGLSCVVGRATDEGLDDIYERVKSRGAFGATELAFTMEQAFSTSPRRAANGLPVSWKEAARIAKQPGWGELTPERVYDQPGFGLRKDEIGSFEASMRRRNLEEKHWRDVPFSEKRAQLSDSLEKLGFSASDKGNPMTMKQFDYLFALSEDARRQVPDEVFNVSFAGALSSKEAASLISRLEQSFEWETEPEKPSKLETLIGAAHGKYEETHGEFVPVTEREGVRDTAGVRVMGKEPVQTVGSMKDAPGFRLPVAKGSSSSLNMDDLFADIPF